eukprot:jgi/Chrzof1/14816/Cz09g17120.t1
MWTCHAGMDLCFVLAVWSCALILPINITGQEVSAIIASQGGTSTTPAIQLGPGTTVDKLAADVAASRYVFSDLDRLSMANVSPGSPRLWAHMVSVYVITAITLRVSASVDVFRW